MVLDIERPTAVCRIVPDYITEENGPDKLTTHPLPSNVLVPSSGDLLEDGNCRRVVGHFHSKLLPCQQLELAPDGLLERRPADHGRRPGLWRRRLSDGNRRSGSLILLLPFGQGPFPILFDLTLLLICQRHLGDGSWGGLTRKPELAVLVREPSLRWSGEVGAVGALELEPLELS